MKTSLLVGALAVFAIYSLVAYFDERAKCRSFHEAARDALANFHPAHERRLREHLAARAHAHGIEIDSVTLDKRPTARRTLSSALASSVGVPTQNFLVAVDLRYRTTLLGFEREHRVRIEKIVTAEREAKAPSTTKTNAQRGAGLPLPIIVD